MEETTQQKTGNVNDILKILNKANSAFAYEVFIPSLDRIVMFKQISTAQQKSLLKAIIDSPAYNTEFIFALRQIILENCIEDINVDELTIFDKMIIAMTMRAMSISNDLDIQFTIPAGKNPPTEEQKLVRRISLRDLVDTAIKEIKITPAIISDDDGIYTVYCSLPTIYDEYKLENELRNNVTTIEIKNEKELRNTVGEIFTNEIVKYVKKITIKDGDEEINIDLKGIKFKERVQIIGSIPAIVNKKIMAYISSVSVEFGKVLLFKDEVNGKPVEERLKIDASFFTAS